MAPAIPTFLASILAQIARLLFLPFVIGLGGALGLTLGSTIAGIVNPQFAQLLSSVGQLLVVMVPLLFMFTILQVLGSLVWAIPSLMTIPMYSLATYIPTIAWIQLQHAMLRLRR